MWQQRRIFAKAEHYLSDVELLIENSNHTIQHHRILIGVTPVYTLLNHWLVRSQLHFCIGSDRLYIFIISFYTFNVPSVCILYP
jgi:hypothetical protein